MTAIQNGYDANSMQQLVSQIMTTIKNSDTDGTKGLSKAELSAIGDKDFSGESSFFNVLTNSFARIDSDGNGQITNQEISNSLKSDMEKMGILSSVDTQATSVNSNDNTSTQLAKDLMNYFDEIVKHKSSDEENSNKANVSDLTNQEITSSIFSV